MDGLENQAHNLPYELSTFVGREHERAQLVTQLRDARLVTLVGPGGVGKTRLALRVARDVLSAFPDGVWLAELAPLKSDGLVAAAVGAAVGVREQANEALVDTLAAAFSYGRVLIILDNCEHLVSACAAVAERLLQRCASVRVLATSREPLRVPGEVTWVVPPLTVPPPEGEPIEPGELARCDAVNLFVQRARAVHPQFTLTDRNVEPISRICRRLDGLPLALELAAARIRVLSIDEIAARLDDRFDLLVAGVRTATLRQQTLRAAIDWSYELLSEDERRLFARLSVFAATFSIDAVEAVCADTVDGLLDLLSRLVERSLLVVDVAAADGQTRYRLLESMRVFAAEHLVADGDSDLVQQRLAAWCLKLGEQAEAAFRGRDQGRWLHWTEREHDNLRQALEWLVGRGDASAALRLAGAVFWSWALHKRWGEARALLRRVLALPGARTAGRERAKALVGLGTVSVFLGDLETARASFEETIAIGSVIGDERLAMEGRGASQLLHQFAGDFSLLEDEALSMLEDARRMGHTWGEARTLEMLAQVAASHADQAQATAYLTDAERLARASGDSWGLARVLEAMGDLKRSIGEHALAGRLYVQSQALFAELGLGPNPAVIHNLGYVDLAASDARSAAEHFVQAMALFRRVGDRRGTAECLIGIGCVHSARGHASRAVRLFAAGHTALDALGTHLWPSNHRDYERWLAAACGRLTNAAFDDAWQQGQTLSVEAAVAECTADRLPDAPTDRTPAAQLTRREREVASLVARGLSNRQVAEALVVTEKTVANHLQRAAEKLDVHSRAHLAARAAELGLTA